MKLEVCSKERFSEVINSGDIVLVDFFATWCGPCKMMGPILEELADELGEGKKIIKVDIDQEKELAIKNGVMAVPTLIAFKNGKATHKAVGLQSKESAAALLD